MQYKFKEHMFVDKAYAPYYKQYLNHRFKIVGSLLEDESGEHVFLSCTTKPDLLVHGCVHKSDLEPIT